MIPIEFLWLMLVAIFGIIGMTRGLWKELGVTTILALSLFALRFGWDQVGAKIVDVVPGSASAETIAAAYFSFTLLFVAFIAYEGVSLAFPIKTMTGIGKAILGLPGGLLNGYLIVGTIWDVVADAGYFGISVPFGSGGTDVAISKTLTYLHDLLINYLPNSFLNEFMLLFLGIIFLLIIVLK